ncbi:MAG: flavodoxin family protein [Eubacteriales bacterium]|jgi:multimeric flavodoxin WrbA
MVIIISDDSRRKLGSIFEEALFSIKTQVMRFSADKLNIEPCIACSSCSGKTYGRCIIQDDMQKLLPNIIRCQSLLLVSPIVFGGVSFHIKKVMDRMAAIGDPRYYYKDGELVKGMSNQGINYYMVGIGDNISEAEKAAFLFLHEENIKIMNVKGKAFIFDSINSKQTLDEMAREIIND